MKIILKNMQVVMFLAYIIDMKAKRLNINEVKTVFRTKLYYIQLFETTVKLQLLSTYKLKYKVKRNNVKK